MKIYYTIFVIFLYIIYIGIILDNSLYRAKYTYNIIFTYCIFNKLGSIN